MEKKLNCPHCQSQFLVDENLLRSCNGRVLCPVCAEVANFSTQAIDAAPYGALPVVNAQAQTESTPAVNAAVEPNKSSKPTPPATPKTQGSDYQNYFVDHAWLDIDGLPAMGAGKIKFAYASTAPGEYRTPFDLQGLIYPKHDQPRSATRPEPQIEPSTKPQRLTESGSEFESAPTHLPVLPQAFPDKAGTDLDAKNSDPNEAPDTTLLTDTVLSATENEAEAKLAQIEENEEEAGKAEDATEASAIGIATAAAGIVVGAVAEKEKAEAEEAPAAKPEYMLATKEQAKTHSNIAGELEIASIEPVAAESQISAQEEGVEKDFTAPTYEHASTPAPPLRVQESPAATPASAEPWENRLNASSALSPSLPSIPPIGRDRPAAAALPKITSSSASKNDAMPSFLRKQQAVEKRRPWLLAALLLLPIGLAAGSYFAWQQRDTLFANYPSLRPPIRGVAKLLGSKLAPYKNIQAITVNASTLSKTPNNPASYKLEVELGNTDPQAAVIFPHIRLSLLDADARPIVERSIKASDLGMAGASIEAQGKWQRSLYLDIMMDPKMMERMVAYKVTVLYDEGLAAATQD